MNKNFGTIIRFISPKHLAVYLLVFSILMTFIPTKIYEGNLHERLLMRSNVSLYTLLILSTISFLIGVWTIDKIAFPHTKSSKKIKINRLTYYFPQLISLVGSLLLLIALQKSIGIYFLLRNSLSDASPGLRYAVFQVMGNANLSWVTPVGYFAIVSGFWYLKVNKSIALFDRLLYIASLSFSLLGAFLQLSKAPIISVTVLLFSCYVIVNSYLNLLNLRRLALNFLLIMVLIVIIFYTLQTRRYSSVSGGGITQLLGYFPASYNRLSALLDSKLMMPASNGFYYTNLGLWTLPVIGRMVGGLFNLTTGISIPTDGFDVWYRSFEAVNRAGLNRNFIWITTYGEAFQDYGWFALLWFYIYGAFMSVFWKLLIKRNSVGLFIYPILILTMQWWSIASIFSRDTLIVIFVAILVKMLSHIRLPKLTYRKS